MASFCRPSMLEVLKGCVMFFRVGSNLNLEEGTCEAVELMGKAQPWQSKDDGVVEVTNQQVAKVRSAVLVKASQPGRMRHTSTGYAVPSEIHAIHGSIDVKVRNNVCFQELALTQSAVAFKIYSKLCLRTILSYAGTAPSKTQATAA